ncbi:hypothetical protein JTB14_037374 [Gonioctena quinquepunctata]|nr:hypothetical protein JTB14_037374 [Gonioctena quinquepunctata]
MENYPLPLCYLLLKDVFLNFARTAGNSTHIFKLQQEICEHEEVLRHLINNEKIRSSTVPLRTFLKCGVKRVDEENTYKKSLANGVWLQKSVHQAISK